MNKLYVYQHKDPNYSGALFVRGQRVVIVGGEAKPLEVEVAFTLVNALGGTMRELTPEELGLKAKEAPKAEEAKAEENKGEAGAVAEPQGAQEPQETQGAQEPQETQGAQEPQETQGAQEPQAQAQTQAKPRKKGAKQTRTRV